MSKQDIFQHCVDFCRKMYWHLQFTEDVKSYKLMAYKNAADTLRYHGSLEDVEKLIGIGPSLLASFAIIAKGKVPQELKDIESHGPPFSVSELTRIPSVGPKTAQKLYENYEIASLKDLAKKITEHEITDPKLVAAFYDMDAVAERMPRTHVAGNIAPILESIRSVIGDAQMELVGSFRRHRPEIRDIDILIGLTDLKIIKQVVRAAKTFADSVKLIDKQGEAKAEIQITIAERQRKLDIYFIEPRFWGSALMHFTGPVKYNIAVRNAAKKLNLKASQYGITNLKTKKIRRFSTELEFCERLGIPYVEPELRDHFQSMKLPVTEGLVTQESIIGDLHTHTVESDGFSTTEDVVSYYLGSKLRFLGISNHSQGSGGGMTAKAHAAYHSRIRKVFRKKNVVKASGKTRYARILCSAEIDIRVDGTLDYDADFIKTLDYAILSIHHKSDFQPTQRLTAAINTLAEIGVPGIIAHPTNRIIGHRAESPAAWSEIFKLCALHNIAVEINGQGDRVDLPDTLIVKAAEAGCIFALSSDFHGKDPKQMSTNIGNAVMQARRGLLTSDRIINADISLFKKWLGSKYQTIFKSGK